MNNLAEERVFSLAGRTEDQYTYNIYQELGTTLTGDFTVAGKDSSISVIAQYVPTGDYGSLFKVVQDDTDLKILNITITDAVADGIKDYGSGSVLYQNADNVSTTFTNTVITGNSSLNNGGAVYNEKGTVTIAGSGGFSDNDTQSGNGGAIYNNNVLNITAGVSQSITFENNTANGADNDIYNTTDGVINVNGAGIVNINSGIAGLGEIEKSGSGTFNINADSSGYTGKFTQTAGTTNVYDSFFAGESIVNNGSLNFHQNGFMDAGSLEINDGAVNLYDDSYLDGIDAALNDCYLNLIDDSYADNVTFDVTGGTMNVTSDATVNDSTIDFSDGLINIAGKVNDTDITQTGGTLDFYSGGSFDGGTLDISDGTIQFATGGELTAGKIDQSGGTLNWAGTKQSAAELVVSGGTLNVLNNSTLSLNNAADSVGKNTDVYIGSGSTINNILGKVILNSDDVLNGALVNSSKVTFDNFAKDFTQKGGSYSQTTAGAELNLINNSQIQTGSHTNITNGTINIGSGVSTGSLLALGAGSTLGTSVAVNVYDGNTFAVNGGSAVLESGDILNGTVALISGSLHLDNIKNNGVFVASAGNLYLNTGALDINNGSAIAQAATVNIAQGANLNINSDAIAVLDKNDVWKGDVNLTTGKLILSNFANSKNDVDVNKLNMTGGTLCCKTVRISLSETMFR
jgi:hypothetical protein